MIEDGAGAQRSGGKRGRKQQRPDPAQGRVAEFAHQLCELKEAAGDPSYDRMRAEFGAAASKSALSAAARGRDLPSWETTWEFVRSLAVEKLDQDEETVRRDWSARWERARTEEPTPTPPVASAPPRRTKIVAVSTVVVGALVATGLFFLFRPSEPRPIPGDASMFVGDVTVPDGTQVRVGERFVKTWEIRNTGSVRWEGRYLEQLGARDSTADCTAPARVSIATVEPGYPVRISVPVDAGDKPGRCKMQWKMVDEDGRQYFAAALPVYFDVLVVP